MRHLTSAICHLPFATWHVQSPFTVRPPPVDFLGPLARGLGVFASKLLTYMIWFARAEVAEIPRILDYLASC
jgi:hypothetical protein